MFVQQDSRSLFIKCLITCFSVLIEIYGWIYLFIYICLEVGYIYTDLFGAVHFQSDPKGFQSSLKRRGECTASAFNSNILWFYEICFCVFVLNCVEPVAFAHLKISFEETFTPHVHGNWHITYTAFKQNLKFFAKSWQNFFFVLAETYFLLKSKFLCFHPLQVILGLETRFGRSRCA